MTTAVQLDKLIAEASDRLQRAQTSGEPCAPVRDLLPDGDLAIAYEVQSRTLARLVADGARPVGRKIGLTNPKVQAQLGVDRPDFGVLLDTMQCQQNHQIELSRLLQPKIEAELAFILGTDLDRPDITESDVALATLIVLPALEIVDSRIADWDISIVDTVADNASSGLFVLGTGTDLPQDVDLATVAMTLLQGDTVVSSGTGADCLGNPLTAVAWLANTARDFGAPLRRGDIVLSGALGPMVTVASGSCFTAVIEGIGQVTASFDEGNP
jgi:2-keto-4-pentenoate hydratase